MQLHDCVGFDMFLIHDWHFSEIFVTHVLWHDWIFVWHFFDMGYAFDTCL